VFNSYHFTSGEQLGNAEQLTSPCMQRAVAALRLKAHATNEANLKIGLDWILVNASRSDNWVVYNNWFFGIRIINSGAMADWMNNHFQERGHSNFAILTLAIH